jgi:hypothetical protein
VEDPLGKLKGLAGTMGRGLLIQFAPSIFKGILVESLSRMDRKEIIRYIQENVSLWDHVGPEDRVKARNLFSNLPEFDWLTVEWGINAIKKDLPAVASLFMGWPEASCWLNSQFEFIRGQLHEVDEE